VVTVRGYAADPPGSTPAGRQDLARRRARVVAEALTEMGVDNRIVSKGLGTPPGETAIVNGQFSEQAASRIRRVEIDY
jgi:outer membrane protein OmpA-like peptidoglycan-associated protein